MITVDTRWRGAHGISRYAREVISRLTVPWEPAALRGRPTSARDMLSPRWNTSNVTYSPGFNAGPGPGRQLVTVHDLIHLQTPSLKYSLYYNTVLRPAIHRMGQVLTVSATSANALAAWLGDGVKVIDTGNGCSDEFTPGAASTQRRSYVLYVGNLKAHKNVDVVLRAIHLVPGARLIAVTNDAGAFTKRAYDLGVVDKIDSRQDVTDPQLAELYRGASATVLPSILEGFGLPALESVCSGTPVIYWHGCDSVREIVRGTGVAVSSHSDEQEWAEAIASSLESPQSVAADMFRTRYSWDTVASKVDSALSEVESIA